MKGIIKVGGIRYVGDILLIFLFTTLVQTLSADDLEIVVVKSSENLYFNQTIETLINSIDDHAQFKVINNNTLNSFADTLQKANVVVTLGDQAASKISSQSPNQLIIHAYITREQSKKLKHSNQNHISVLLDQPLERYLAFSHYILNLKKLAIIDRSGSIPVAGQQNLLQKLNLKLEQYLLDNSNTKLLSTVRQLIRENEALLMLPDQSIYNRDTLKGILLTTYRGRIPVISYSPGHVKSGALAAIYSSPANIGQHLANLLNQRHKNRLNAKNEIVFAEYYSIAINQRVAHSLGLDLPSDERLRQLIDETTK